MAPKTSVSAFLEGLTHARLADILALREIILDAAPGLTEHIKWNAPSFCWNGDDRITMRLQPKDRLELIFHRGVKPNSEPLTGFTDPSGRIEWAAPDRGLLRIGDPGAERDAITALVLAWIAATG